ncbi:GntR family transcriptional regulator [Thalassotalea piscium]|uniref:DNA-binding GntR family transcriptional regulator n=1 Tax=Thalassotalea piscium TaxID=1230533 RepID=A0A7X0NGR5_9GAMM|nr:GntR family transcriptional regulator [Thalassotalea piscium]MBB6543159.1 DNA-binding GntR family transcriptional regulator [Thalassotalea piscium]
MKKALETHEKNKKISDKEIYKEIFDAILSFRLHPGTKLTEDNLSKIFNVGRTTVRSALLRLSQDHIIEIQPNKGAFIATPTTKQAMNILEARKLIEVAIIKDVIKHATASDYDLLRRIVKAEQDNIDLEQIVEGIQLGGDFHLMLAKLSKNSTLERIVTTLIPQTSLVIVLYQTPDSPKCSYYQHFELIDVMQKGQVEKASKLMSQHIDGITNRLKLEQKKPMSDLVDVFKKH